MKAANTVREILAVARSLCADSDVGEPVTFTGDSFQMPFDVPGDKTYKYKGKVISQRGDILTVKLSAPRFAAGKVMKVDIQKEDTLQIG